MNPAVRRFLSLVLVIILGSSFVFAGEGSDVMPVNPWMIVPFIALLLAIAVAPLIDKQWWERSYLYVSMAPSLITVAYYIFGLHNPIRLLPTTIEYVSFIAFIGSLFVVSGGIHIRIRGRATPLANVLLLSIGAVVANIVGTTGASMILIRPYLRVNRYHIRPYHIVLFIFIVSNMGGALTPIGDPPLFLGYLRGIPFFWVAEHLWYQWLFAIVLILGIFYVLDLLSFRRLSKRTQHAVKEAPEEGGVSGLQNVLFLVLILIAVFITDPPFLREALMIAAAAGSYLTTKREIHRKNDFNFHPIREVAVLFAGIFATMIPALDWLQLNASTIGINTAGQFYWATGFLSAFLDNAPTYLNFLTAAIGLLVDPDTVHQVNHLVQTHGVGFAQIAGNHAVEVRNTFETLMKYHYDMVASGNVPLNDIFTSFLIGNKNLYLQAISISAVFFGACTYIGNGPNFMVKSIAEQSGVLCPSFLGYIICYTLPVLVPVFVLTWYLFFRG